MGLVMAALTELLITAGGRPTSGWTTLVSSILGSSAAITLGAILGWTSDLLYKVRQQSHLLAEQRDRGVAQQLELEAEVRTRHAAEEALQAAHGQLEQRVEARTLELQRANARLQDEIGQREHVQLQLQHQAWHDILTGLPNRALLLERLHHRIAHSLSHPDSTMALLFLDLDHFKYINDSLGHQVGDQLLIAMAERLKSCVRATDMVARLGGDEFVILAELQRCDSPNALADRIQEVSKAPFELDQHRVVVSTSIGIVVPQATPTTPEALLQDADIALYRAKSAGKACSVQFEPLMRTLAQTRLSLESGLRKALQDGEFYLQYQPILSLAEYRIVGFEALLRWEHPEQGNIPPGEFISIAEETGLIVPIGEWVLREACRQLQAWHQQHPLSSPLTMSVNLSSRQLMQPEFVGRLKTILQAVALPPRSLHLEITESVLISNTEYIQSSLSALRQSGVCVQMDDFGTGYSSLSILHQLAIDTLKIDRSFIHQLKADESNWGLVRAVITLARELGMGVVAEGVETAQQLQMLRQLSCEQAQGFFIAPPMTGEAVNGWLAAGSEIGPINQGTLIKV